MGIQDPNPSEKKMETRFAPAKRACGESVKRQSASLFSAAYLGNLYSVVSDIVVILNPERQIVFFNKNLEAVADIPISEAICGLRLGEVLNCSHAFETEGGCGTTEFCQECGAVKAILTSQTGRPDIQECRITRRESGEALDLRVRTSQIRVDNEEYTIAAVADISHEKRRRILERIFFHDVMNTAVGVRGLSELLSVAEPEQLDEFRTMIFSGAEKLVDEIRMQKDLAAAENNELVLKTVPIDSLQLLQEVVKLYKKHEAAKDRILVIDPKSMAVNFKSDQVLLFRVIANMTKNALEACLPGDTVTVGCFQENDNVRFQVHNPTVIPKAIQLQIFQRSFSTKGAGRGLGTYSMKLLSERYLQGNVAFVSSREAGTTFFGVYPLVLNK